MLFFAEAASKFAIISADFSAIAILSCVLGGLGIFLLGMQQISEGLQGVAGPKMRKLVAAATTNRFAGVATGTVVTAIIQSSSVTTVMVVGMVTSGIMTLTQAINVIIGANIGTTATAWLVAAFPKIGTTAIAFIIGIAAIIYLFAKREGWKFIGLIFLGLGLIFFGLDFIKGAMDPIASSDGLREVMSMFSAVDAAGNFSAWGMIKCVFVGAVATAIVQSSSATTGIAIILVAQGSIDFYSAATLVLGMNIGTTITAWLAALNAPTEARRAALAHSLFNIIGTCIMAPIFPIALPIANKIFNIEAMNATDLTFAVAGVHTAFNVVNTCFFLPIVKPFATLIARIIPDAKVHELPRLTVLNPLKLAPVVAVEQARKEVEQMSQRCEGVVDQLRSFLTHSNTEEIEKDIFHAEEELDILQHEVAQFLGVIMTTNLPSDVAKRARMLLRVADEFETVSDDVVAIQKQFIRMRKGNMTLSERCQNDLLGLHDMCRSFALMVFEAFRQGKMYAADILNHLHTDANEITIRAKEIRQDQMNRMAEKDPTLNPICAIVTLDILNLYRRLKEDCLNIGEAMLEESRM